jgi:hypothetical protein
LKPIFSNRVRKSVQCTGMTTLQGWHYEYSSHEHDTAISERLPMAMRNTCAKMYLIFPL